VMARPTTNRKVIESLIFDRLRKHPVPGPYLWVIADYRNIDSWAVLGFKWVKFLPCLT
jgi:hypothetical protein